MIPNMCWKVVRSIFIKSCVHFNFQNRECLRHVPIRKMTKMLICKKSNLALRKLNYFFQYKNTIIGNETWKKLKLKKRCQKLYSSSQSNVMSILSSLKICRFLRATEEFEFRVRVYHQTCTNHFLTFWSSESPTTSERRRRELCWYIGWVGGWMDGQ